jgi:hypothetical protein
MGLDLLQVDMRMQSNSVASAMTAVVVSDAGDRATAHAAAESVLNRPAVPSTEKVAAQIAESADVAVVSDQDRKVSSDRLDKQPPEALVSTLPTEEVSLLGQQDSEAHVHHSATNLLVKIHRLTASMSQGTRGTGTVLLLVLVMFCCVCCVFAAAGANQKGGFGHDPLQARGGSRMPGGYSPNPAYVSVIDTPRKDSPQQASPPGRNIVMPPPAAVASNFVGSGRGSGQPVPPVSMPPAMPSSTMRVGPPAICPALILPNTEARFMIPVSVLKGGAGAAVDILGTSGRKLLHCEKSETPDGRNRLAISSRGNENDPRAIILGPSGWSPNQNYDLFGKGEAPYGTLEPQRSGGFVLKVGGRTVMSIETGSDAFHMTASANDGTLLAQATKSFKSGGSMDEEVWNLRVTKGNDAVLISGCMLAPLLFRQ